MIVSYGFYNFSANYVFEVQESIADIPTKLPHLGDSEKSRSTSGSGGNRRYL